VDSKKERMAMFNFKDNPDEYKRLMQLEVLIAIVAIAASIVMFNFGVMTGALFAAIAGAFFLMDAIVEGLRLLGASRGFSRFIGTAIAIPALAGYLIMMFNRFPVQVA
jgi:hypothetical protein